MNFTTIRWDHQEQAVVLLDQTQLPNKIIYETCQDLSTVVDAIVKLKVRGAPAIGITAAFGVVVGVKHSQTNDFEKFSKEVTDVVDILAATRPTAVNLFWALERMQKIVCEAQSSPVEEIKQALVKEALQIQREDEITCQQIGRLGAELLQSGHTVLTHCNAGALATSGIVTALAIIYSAQNQGKQIKIYANETRPILQGARLTTWELTQAGIDVTLICDNMAGQVMQERRIDSVIVGADRVAANGDVANKIGTYSVAVLAKTHEVPFYVAAPFSSVDLSVKSGFEIPIEERDPAEIRHGLGKCIALEEVKVYNPAFDITPASYVSAVITERGIARKPYSNSLSALSHQIREPIVSG